MEIDSLAAIIRSALPKLQGRHQDSPYLTKIEVLDDEGRPIADENWYYYDGEINVRQLAELIAKGMCEGNA